MTPAEQASLLLRASPGYRDAVLGRQRVRGAVQFATHAISQRCERGYTILRAAVDEGQVVELRLPRGLDLCIVKKRGGAG